MSASDLAESVGPTVAEILAKLGTDSKTGLNSVELQERLSKYGSNALPEDTKSALSGLLAYFWGPIPWMIEAAALMALIVGDWGDLTIITSLLLFNALLGFWEEHEASNALDATFGVFVLPILKGKFGVPAVLGMVAAVSVLGLIVTLVSGREDTE